MLIFKGFRDRLPLGGQDARQEQAAANPTTQELGHTRQTTVPPLTCSPARSRARRESASSRHVPPVLTNINFRQPKGYEIPCSIFDIPESVVCRFPDRAISTHNAVDILLGSRETRSSLLNVHVSYDRTPKLVQNKQNSTSRQSRLELPKRFVRGDSHAAPQQHGPIGSGWAVLVQMAHPAGVSAQRPRFRNGWDCGASEQPLTDRFLRRRQLPAIQHPIEGDLAITAARPSTVDYEAVCESSLVLHFFFLICGAAAFALESALPGETEWGSAGEQPHKG